MTRCHKNSDLRPLKNSDPQKLRLTRCIKNSDPLGLYRKLRLPKNSDPPGESKTQILSCIVSQNFIVAKFNNLHIFYIQQLILMFNEIYLYSTFYICIQQYAFSFNFNQNYFHSTKIVVQLQPKNYNNYFIQQQYLLNFNQNYFHSTIIIIIQLLPCIVS